MPLSGPLGPAEEQLVEAKPEEERLSRPCQKDRRDAGVWSTACWEREEPSVTEQEEQDHCNPASHCLRLPQKRGLRRRRRKSVLELVSRQPQNSAGGRKSSVL